MVNVLEVRNVSFSYRNMTVLEDVNLNLKEGELLCLLGPNGAGKTTLFRCILGLEKFSGNIFVHGTDLSHMRPSKLAKKIAYIPQINYLSFNYSVFEMVLMGTAAKSREWSLPGPAQKQTALEAIETTGITGIAHRGFCSLSGGERQLCLIARAVAQEAGIFVMDEPTANLDYGNQHRIFSLIQSLCRQGRSIIMSTHNPDHALRFSGRIAALHDRRIIAEGPPVEVLNAGLIEKLYSVTENREAVGKV